MRYTKEFKLECIRKYKNGEYITDPGGCSHATFYRKLNDWVHIFDELGEAGLEHSKTMLSFEDKKRCVQRVINGESMNSIATSIRRQETQISKWYNIYLHEGFEGLKFRKKGRPPKMKKEEKYMICIDVRIKQMQTTIV